MFEVDPGKLSTCSCMESEQAVLLKSQSYDNDTITIQIWEIQIIDIISIH